MFDSLKKNPKPNSFSPTCNFPVSPLKVNRREGQGGLGTRPSLTIGMKETIVRTENLIRVMAPGILA